MLHSARKNLLEHYGSEKFKFLLTIMDNLQF